MKVYFFYLIIYLVINVLKIFNENKIDDKIVLIFENF